jgi:hypothetical protein
MLMSSVSKNRGGEEGVDFFMFILVGRLSDLAVCGSLGAPVDYKIYILKQASSKL